jgi:hypothetical protein
MATGLIKPLAEMQPHFGERFLKIVQKLCKPTNKVGFVMDFKRPRQTTGWGL